MPGPPGSVPPGATVSTTKLTPSVTNRYAGADRAAFTYDNATLPEITTVGMNLFVDVSPTQAPAETELTSAAFLRNQNQAPVAAFTNTATGAGHVLLNGGGRAIRTTSSSPSSGRRSRVGSTDHRLDRVAGLGSPTGPGKYTVRLQVTDTGGLIGTEIHTVTVYEAAKRGRRLRPGSGDPDHDHRAAARDGGPHEGQCPEQPVGCRAGSGGVVPARRGALTAQLEQIEQAWPAARGRLLGLQSVGAAVGHLHGYLPRCELHPSAGGAPNGGTDFASQPQWSTRVIDDVDGPDVLRRHLATTNACACDAERRTARSGCARRRTSTAGGRCSWSASHRRARPRVETLPSAIIIAGWFEPPNNGKKINRRRDGHLGHRRVAGRALRDAGRRRAIRASATTRPRASSRPRAPTDRYVDGTGAPNATNRYILDADALARLKATAISLGTYYPAGTRPPTLTRGHDLRRERPTKLHLYRHLAVQLYRPAPAS